MKKIIFIICFILFVSNVCFAHAPELNAGNSQTSSKKVVGIFIDAPSPFVIQDATKDIITRKINVIFTTQKFYVIPLETTSNSMKLYRPKNRSMNFYPVQNFSREDILTLAQDLNCDYALFITVSKGLPNMSADLNSATYKTSITCDFKILNIQNGNYLARKYISKDISSDTIKNGMPVYDNAYSDALEKSLMEFNIDSSIL